MPIKSSELHKLWDTPDNSRLTSKQYSFRLPVHVAAKLAAFCELYPRKSRTEIVGDLLAAAIEEAAEALPFEVVETDDAYERSQGNAHEVYGLREDFRRCANKHYQELEKELGTEKPDLIYKGYGAF